MPEKGTLPADIPAQPNRTYATIGWKGMGDWLGTGTIAARLRIYLPFEKARAFVHTLKLKNSDEWRSFCKGQMPEKGMLPAKIPASPNRTYKNKGWIGMGDWLGTGTIAAQLREYRPFKEARAFVQSLNLKSGSEWRKFCKGELSEKGTLPSDIPAKPNETYAADGWKGMGDWLGTGTIAPRLRKYLSFEQAREFVKSLNLRNGNEWKKFCKGQLTEKGNLPANIPAAPELAYKTKGWSGMGNWLGTGAVANYNKVFKPFEEARAFAHSLKLKNGMEWRRFCKGQIPEKGTLPTDIPASPNRTYANNGWKGMGDWLGK
jgi:hypothetical protein